MVLANASEYSLLNLLRTVSLESMLSRQHVVQEGSCTPVVNFLVVRLVIVRHHFWRLVLRRSAVGEGQEKVVVPRVDDPLSHVEVDERHQSLFLVKHHVVRIDVTMHDSLVSEVN